MQILDCQVKTLGLRSENDGESWMGFYREVEGQGQYVRMITLIKIVHDFLKLEKDGKGRKQFENWFLNFNVLKNSLRWLVKIADSWTLPQSSY